MAFEFLKIQCVINIQQGRYKLVADLCRLQDALKEGLELARGVGVGALDGRRDGAIARLQSKLDQHDGVRSGLAISRLRKKSIYIYI